MGQSLYIDISTYGAIGDGSTDCTAIIAQAIADANSAGGGTIFFPPGTYVTGSQTLYSKVHFLGAGYETSVLLLKPGSNTDLLRGSVSGYGSLVDITAAAGTGSQSGVSGWSVRDLTLDGNKGSQSGASAGIKVYGHSYALENVRIRNCYSEGIYSDYNYGTTSPGECQLVNVRVHGNGGVGVKWAGPMDAMFANITSTGNSVHGFHVGPNATGTVISNAHAFGNTSVNYLIECSSSYTNCVAEGGSTSVAFVGVNGGNWIGGLITGSASGTGVQLGQTSGQTPFAGSVNQSAGVTTSAAASALMLSGSIKGMATSIYFANESNNVIDGYVYQASGTPLSGTWATTDNVRLQVNGQTYNTTQSTFSVDTSASAVKLLNSSTLTQYSNAGTTKLFQVDNTGTLGWGSSADVTLSRTAAGLLSINGGLAEKVTSTSANYTVLAADSTVLANSTSGSITLTLPASPVTGEIHTCIKNDSSWSNTVTVGSVATLTIPGQSITIQYSGSAWVTLGQSSNGSQWRKFTVTTSGGNWTVNGVTAGALTSGSTTQQVALFTTAARQVIHSMVIKHGTAFAATSASAVTASVGTAATPDSLMIASGDLFDVKQAVSTSAFYAAGGSKILDFGATAVVLQMITSNSTPSAITAGSLEVDLLLSVLP